MLAAVVAGATNKEIAEELGVSEQAIKGHVSKLLRHFAVTTRSGLVSAALGSGTLRLSKSSTNRKRISSRPRGRGPASAI